MVEPQVAEPDVPYVSEKDAPALWLEAFAAVGDVEDEAPEIIPDGVDLHGFATKAEFDEYWETEKPGSKKGHVSTWVHWSPEPILEEQDDAGN